MPGTGGGDHSRQREQHTQKLRGKEEREHGYIRGARTCKWLEHRGWGVWKQGLEGQAEAAMEALVGRS